MLGASLGSGQNGVLNPLYQVGGPRSAQLLLKMIWQVRLQLETIWLQINTERQSATKAPVIKITSGTFVE